MDINDNRIKIGDLVTIVPWDCEGIEHPYGHKIYEKKSWDQHKQKMFENFSKKVKITPGSKALITGREEVSKDYNHQIFFWCLVEGNQLIVSHHFIEPV